jgi:pimeloyl-ACP methyl ester carboxylesterase
MGELVSQDFRAMLRTFPRPVLIVNGEHDAFNRWTEKKHLATTQQGSLQTVQGAGHVVNLEHPDQVAKILRTFAGSLDWRL